MNELYLIAGMVLVTFTIRYSMFLVAGRFEFPTWLINALRYVPPAVLTAIIVPAVLIPTGQGMNFSYTNAYLVGAVVAFGISWFSQNLLLTIVLGMAAFWGWQWLVGLIG
jgi:branched-subunit amino acid transport protein